MKEGVDGSLFVIIHDTLDHFNVGIDSIEYQNQSFKLIAPATKPFQSNCLCTHTLIHVAISEEL